MSRVSFDDFNLQHTLDMLDAITVRDADGNLSVKQFEDFEGFSDRSCSEQFLSDESAAPIAEAEEDFIAAMSSLRHEVFRKDALIKIHLERIEQLEKELEISNRFIVEMEGEVESLTQGLEERDAIVNGFQNLKSEYDKLCKRLAKKSVCSECSKRDRQAEEQEAIHSEPSLAAIKRGDTERDIANSSRYLW